MHNELEVTRTRLATRDDERKEHLQKIQHLSEELDSLSDEHARAKRAGSRALDADQMQAVSLFQLIACSRHPLNIDIPSFTRSEIMLKRNLS